MGAIAVNSNESTEKGVRMPSGRVYIAAFCAVLGVMCKGTTFGWSSPALYDMQRPNSEPHLDHNEDNQNIRSWIGSCITLGALAGSLACGKHNIYKHIDMQYVYVH